MQKSVLITGCSSGIGLAAAHELHRLGYQVFAACRQAEDVARMEQAGLIGILMDLDDEGSVTEAAARVITLCHGQLYALFNNAGFGLYGQLTTLSRRALEQQFSTNFFAVHQLTMLLLPALKASPHARIINTSSIMGIIATPGRGAYAASKFALEAWSDTLRMELKDSQVRVSLIEPGPISSHFSANVNQSSQQKPVTNPGIARFFTLPPQAILPKLRHALESPSPRRRYPVTVISYALFLAKRLLPTGLLEKLLMHGADKS